jgi:hypothetical protein
MASLPKPTAIELLEQRLAEIESWLGDESRGKILSDQRHLEEGSAERVCWHHGYASALRDALRLLQGTRRRSFN